MLKIVNSLNIGPRLALGFGVLVLLVLITGLVNLVADSLKQQSYTALLLDQQEATLAQHINSQLLEARRREKDFLLRWQTEGFETAYNNYVVLNQQHVQNVVNLIGELRALTPANDSSRLSELDTIEQTITSYGSGFIKAIGDIKERDLVNAATEATLKYLAESAESISPLVEAIVANEIGEVADAANTYAAQEAASRSLTLAIVGGAVVAGVLLAVLIYRSISIPIQELANVAASLSQRNYSRRANLTQTDETGALAQTLNIMAEDIQSVIKGLEIRTRDLQTVSEVSARVATILEPERLLRDVADLTKERFRLYHSHIYLIDEAGTTLVSAAGAGYVGRQMVAEKRTIEMVNLQSIVANAARSHKSIIVNDLRQSPTFLPHPLLPNTRSELAVPLAARGQLLGVLDLQSDEVGYFNEHNLAVIELMASQIAAAISNARLYEIAERSSRHERALGRIERKIQDAMSMDEILQTGVRELGKALRVPYTAIELHVPSKQDPNHDAVEN